MKYVLEQLSQCKFCFYTLWKYHIYIMKTVTFVTHVLLNKKISNFTLWPCNELLSGLSLQINTKIEGNFFFKREFESYFEYFATLILQEIFKKKVKFFYCVNSTNKCLHITMSLPVNLYTWSAYKVFSKVKLMAIFSQSLCPEQVLAIGWTKINWICPPST